MFLIPVSTRASGYISTSTSTPGAPTIVYPGSPARLSVYVNERENRRGPTASSSVGVRAANRLTGASAVRSASDASVARCDEADRGVGSGSSSDSWVGSSVSSSESVSAAASLGARCGEATAGVSTDLADFVLASCAVSQCLAAPLIVL